MKDDVNEEIKKEEERINELHAQLEFARSFLSALGINAEIIEEKIDALEKAKKDKDPEAIIAAFHGLLNTVSSSTEAAMPEIKQFKSEAMGILKPIIDLLIKDTLIGIASYIGELKVESIENTTKSQEKLNELKAKNTAHLLGCYIKEGVGKKMAAEFIKAELTKPQVLSLSLPTTSVNTQGCKNDTRSENDIVDDFIELARKDARVLIGILPLIKSFSDEFPGMH